jgi:diguanylate cyclase (GGDEF)-like protein
MSAMANVRRVAPGAKLDADALKVLIVEDSEDDAFLLGHELAAAVNDVCYQRVDNADAMRRALSDGDWDIVISDHAMPRFSSDDAFTVLKASGKDIPFIIYSGTISENTAVSAMAGGVHDFVEKGNLSRLVPVVRRELKGAASEQARRRAESRVYQLSHYDQLTGLPNRALFYERATDLLAQARAAGRIAGVALADLDRFMRINNTFGYATGDLLVRAIAERLRDLVGTPGCVARLGRDEFAIMTPPCVDVDGLRRFAESLTRTFRNPFSVDGQEFYITLSIGIAVAPVDGEEVSSLLVNAESAMFTAKKNGRNNVQFYLRSINAASAERLALESDLRRALERRELHLNYQPSVDIGTGRITGCEALVRWRHPTRGMVPPDKFIPLADEVGLINEIGRFVIDEATGQMQRWRAAGMGDLNVSVNVSAVQFREEALVGVVRDALGKSGLDPHHLTLEITESVLMQDAEATIGMLRALKAMGLSISIDDFGTGYSSLAYLRRFPIDTLKVDKAFVRDVTQDADDAAIVRAIITLAKSLKLEVVAEGVETIEQLAFLRLESCDRIQGYLFSRPLEPAAFEALVREGKALP